MTDEQTRAIEWEYAQALHGGHSHSAGLEAVARYALEHAEQFGEATSVRCQHCGTALASVAPITFQVPGTPGRVCERCFFVRAQKMTPQTPTLEQRITSLENGVYPRLNVVEDWLSPVLHRLTALEGAKETR